MNRLTFVTLFFFLYAISIYAQESIDPDYIKENIPVSPEVGTLGTHGNINTNPYNGKVNISIPIHQIDLDGIIIPIQLSYDTGGIRVNSESSWVGMNWSLSSNASITRDIQGNDDLNENIIPNDNGHISSYVFNEFDVTTPETASPYVPIDEVIEIHTSYGVSESGANPKNYADTQPDIFNVSLFGKNYKFRFNKRNGISNSLTTHIFNNHLAEITYDLVEQSFLVKDDRGFEFLFSTKDYSATISSSQSSHSDAISQTKELTIDRLQEDQNQSESTVITSWLLDRITSPTGQELFFTYEEGAHFTHPTYSGRMVFRESEIDIGDDEWGESYDQSWVKYSSSISIIHSNYLSNISGDFGQVDFISTEDRRDLLSGSDLGAIFPTTFFNGPGFVAFTKTSVENRLDKNHGTPSNIHYKPTGRRLSSIDIKDYNDNTIRTAIFTHGYYNDHRLGNSDESKYLRLKLDGVSILDKEYKFEYNQSNGLPEKGTFDTDFWGFYNGANNITDVPSIGRFGTQEISQQRDDTNRPKIGQTYFDFDGGDRGADFNYGNRGNLIKITYPTGGYSEFEYESNKALINGPAPYIVTDYFDDGRMRWTNLTNEDNYKFTYQYLKNAENPNYNYFDYRYDPGTTIETNPLNFTNQRYILVENNVGVVHGEGLLDLISATNENFEQFYNVPKYFVRDINNSSNIYPLFYWGDWQNSADAESAEDSPPGSATTVVPPGSYELIRQQNTEEGMPIVALFPEDFSYTIEVPDTSDPDLPQFIEEFPIGGSRIKTITNTSNDGAFINKKHFDYTFPTIDSQELSSSGKLMDDLIFHTKFSGFFSYTPSRPGYGGAVSGITITSNSNLGQNPSAQGSHIGYSFVREYQLDKDDILLSITDRSFSNEPNQYYKTSFEHIFYWNPFYPAISIRMVEAQNALMLGMPARNSFEFSNGNLLMESLYDCSENLVRSTQNEYESFLLNDDSQYYANFNSLSYIASDSEGEATWYENGNTYITYKLPNSYASVSVPTFSQTIDYLSNGQTYTESYYTYDDESQNMVSSETVVSDGESRITKYYYPNNSEVWDDGDIAHLRADKQYNQIVMSESYVNDQKLATSRLYFSKNFDTGDRPLVTSSNSSKGTTAPEPRALYEKYDDDGHVLQSRLENGTPVSYIWGYNNQHVIAKVQNATYAQLSTYVSNLQSLSDSDTTSCLGDGGCNEQSLRTALNNLRSQSSLSDTQITTYTYDPLVGVTSITDPRGSTVYYTYDTFNRLEAVYDQNNFLLSKNEYNINHDLLATQGEDALGVAACGSNLADDPGGPGGDGPFEEDTGGRMANNTIVLDGQTYPDLSNAVSLVDTQTVGDDVTLYYQAFPYGGSGNLMYRWKIKGETFTPYSSSPTWTRVFECDTEDARGIEVICEVKDMSLNLTERSRLRHVVLCNN